MKRLFVCCDGTWNSASDAFQGVPVPTNVVRFFNVLSDRDPQQVTQLKYYHAGVGADEGRIRRLVVGALGLGLSRDIRMAYKWLSDHYESGFDIFVTGFSRGAFTARSLVGMMHHCGLPAKASWELVEEAWTLYRLDPTVDRNARRQDEFRRRHGAPPPIRFLGVWETVGALGIPETVPFLSFLKNRYRFHDTSLSPEVQRAVQALAIDEQRNSFFPTLWTGTDGTDDGRVSQVWFPGVHADVGGGYKETELSDVALTWMIAEATRCGADFDAPMLQQLQSANDQSPAAIHGVLHNSLTAFYRLIGYRPRSFPLLARIERRGSESISDFALARQASPPIFQAPYRPNVDASAGIEVRVFASPLWNWTGIYIREGTTYRFSVPDGQVWFDWKHACGPDGSRGTWLQNLFKRSRRVEAANWFELCGAIAYPGEPSVGGVPPAPFYFRIGRQFEFKAPCSGYLYCFANDAAWAYGNNHGSMRVDITELTAAGTPAVHEGPNPDDDLTAPAAAPGGSGRSGPS
jgi:hypothetical protein